MSLEQDGIKIKNIILLHLKHKAMNEWTNGEIIEKELEKEVHYNNIRALLPKMVKDG